MVCDFLSSRDFGTQIDDQLCFQSARYVVLYVDTMLIAYLISGGRCVPAMKDTTLGTTGAKRKKRDYRLMVLNCFFFCSII